MSDVPIRLEPGEARALLREHDRERKRRERQKRKKRLYAGEVVVHGQMSTYLNWMCRCCPCTDAYMEYKSLYDAGRRKPSHRTLPQELENLCRVVSPELAVLIQEQYDDDRTIRVGWGKRLPADDRLAAEGH